MQREGGWLRGGISLTHEATSVLARSVSIKKIVLVSTNVGPSLSAVYSTFASLLPLKHRHPQWLQNQNV